MSVTSEIHGMEIGKDGNESFFTEYVKNDVEDVEDTDIGII